MEGKEELDGVKSIFFICSGKPGHPQAYFCPKFQDPKLYHLIKSGIRFGRNYSPTTHDRSIAYGSMQQSFQK